MMRLHNNDAQPGQTEIMAHDGFNRWAVYAVYAASVYSPQTASVYKL